MFNWIKIFVRVFYLSLFCYYLYLSDCVDISIEFTLTVQKYRIDFLFENFFMSSLINSIVYIVYLICCCLVLFLRIVNLNSESEMERFRDQITLYRVIFRRSIYVIYSEVHRFFFNNIMLCNQVKSLLIFITIFYKKKENCIVLCFIRIECISRINIDFFLRKVRFQVNWFFFS